VQPHFPGNVRQNTMTIGQLDPKHGVRQQLDDCAFYFNCVFARHVRISGSFFVIRTVCSKCAEGIPSAVRTVHPSSSNLTSEVPMLIIGSIASVMPAFNFGPLPRLP
jgi:hypothetical protein